MKFRIQRDKPRSDCAKTVLLAELDRALDSLAGAKTDPASMHEARKQLKRMRALLNLMAPSFGEAGRAEARRVRDAARRLARHREVDALKELVATEYDGANSQWWSEQVHQMRRAGSPDEKARSRDIAAVRRSLSAVRKRLEALDVEEVSRPEIRRRFKKVFKKTRDAFRTACESPSQESMHEWRKRLKRLVNQARLLASWGTSSFGPFRRKCKKLDDQLGYARDCGILADLGRRRLDAEGEDADVRSHVLRMESKQSAFNDQAVKKGKVLFERKPGEFVRKMIR